MGISKNKIRYIRSLDLKKKRKEEKVFIAEGPKLLEELSGVLPCHILVATEKWLNSNPQRPANEIFQVTNEELTRISFLKNPQEVIAVFGQPEYNIDYQRINNSLSLVLDDIQDPGNLGTIIRIADWFGIEHIICSPNTADVYNPKTIQATMGSIARVKVFYTQLSEFLNSLETMDIYGTFLDGDNIYAQNLNSKGLIVMGNEGNGISPEIKKRINKKLCIPSYPGDRPTSESLNVAIATAITCAEFRRQNISSVK